MTATYSARMLGSSDRGPEPRHGAARPRWVVPAALLVAYASLGLSWAFTNAPFVAPDETQHYLRALGIRTDGALVGPRTAYTGPILSPAGTEWRRKLTRAATVPPGMSPDGLDCPAFRPNVTPVCMDGVEPNPRTIVQDTDVGSYAPLPYLLPALATAAGDDAVSAGRWGRLATLAVWLALLAAAVTMIWDRRVGALSLVGLLVALTPAAVFIGSSLGNSGFEIAASLAFFAALLRIVREAGAAPRAAWIVVAISGSSLALSRSFGVVWIVCGIVVCCVALGRDGCRLLVQRSPRALAITAAVIVGAIGLNAAWELAYGPEGVGVALVPSPSSLYDGVQQVRYAVEGLIGWFGYQDVRIGAFGTVVWMVLAAIMLVVAGWLGDRRERTALLLACLLSGAVPVYLYAAVTSTQGIQTQGRHLLPLLVLVPLLCGEIIRGHEAALRTPRWRLLLPAIATTAAATHVGSWWVNAHRYSVGADGPWWFLPNPEWTPPGGWILWSAVTIAGALLMAAAMVERLPINRSFGERSAAN